MRHSPCPRCVAVRARLKLREMLDSDPFYSIDTLNKCIGKALGYFDVIADDCGDVCEDHAR